MLNETNGGVRIPNRSEALKVALKIQNRGSGSLELCRHRFSRGRSRLRKSPFGFRLRNQFRGSWIRLGSATGKFHRIDLRNLRKIGATGIFYETIEAR